MLHHGFDASLGRNRRSLAGGAGSDTVTSQESAEHVFVPDPLSSLPRGRRSPSRVSLSCEEGHRLRVVARPASQVLRSLYTFFWNRWFIDALYNRLFVTGAQRAWRDSSPRSSRHAFDRSRSPSTPVADHGKGRATRSSPARRHRGTAVQRFVRSRLVRHAVGLSVRRERAEAKSMPGPLSCRSLVAPLRCRRSWFS